MSFYGVELSSRLLLGTARYPSPKILAEAIEASQAEVVTVSLRREAAAERGGQSFWSFIRGLGARVLPNTAGCHTVAEAVTTAHMARALFDTPWIKLEVIRDDETLQPDVFGLVEAARVLSEEGFEVSPYTTEDLGVGVRACHRSRAHRFCRPAARTARHGRAVDAGARPSRAWKLRMGDRHDRPVLPGRSGRKLGGTPGACGRQVRAAAPQG